MMVSTLHELFCKREIVGKLVCVPKQLKHSKQKCPNNMQSTMKNTVEIQATKQFHFRCGDGRASSTHNMKEVI